MIPFRLISLRSPLILALMLLLSLLALGQNTPGTQTVLVFPFDNSTHQPGLEWVSEAFPEILSQRLSSPSLFLISRDDRQYAFERMGIPETLHASRATLYRIAGELDADFIVLGSYSFDGQSFTARAQVLDMKSMRLSADQVESGQLSQFAAIQTALAWDVLRQMRPGYSVSRQEFLQRFPALRLDAFENYVRGMVAGAAAEKIRYLQKAVSIDPKYSPALLLLAKSYFAQHDYEQASAWFAKLPAEDASFGEASFLIGLSEYHLGHFDKASAAFKTTAERIPLTEVLNDLGASELRRNHHEAVAYLQKAVSADPADPDYHFNLALALFRKGDAPAAQRQLHETLSLNPEDTEARQFQDSLLVNPYPNIPSPRIKSNYDESSYRQLSVELQNAIDESIGKAKPAAQAALHLERARELLASGAASEAESQFRESLSQQPVSPEALSGLAHALLLQQKFSEACVQAEASIDLLPNAEAYMVLARSDWHGNNRDGAAQKLQKALALEPGNEDAKQLAQEIQSQPAQNTPATAAAPH